MSFFLKRGSLRAGVPVPKSRHRALRVESLEPRQMLSSTPWGASSLDTAEYLLGDVAVTLVLMESQGGESSEDWTAQSIQNAKSKMGEALQWWKDLLATQTSVHSLNFVLDSTYADNPVPTSIEPIAHKSNDYVTWVNEFLTHVEANTSEAISTDIRHFNDSQRQALSTQWAFTVFMVNDENDADGQFAAGGSFSRAFAFPGGQFYVAPAGRPAATFSHELGHIFWARDEYSGAGSYTDRRGYYNAQNWNAANNPTPGFQQVDSIMASGTLMSNAYTQHVSSPSSLKMMGWQDTDQDGIFDVLDVPHRLEGTGYFDLGRSQYQFKGSSQVQALLNLNSSGQQSDIVLNEVDLVEYRLDGGDWQLLQSPDAYQAELDLSIPVGEGVQVVELRTRSVDATTGSTVATSEIFWGRTDLITTTLDAGIQGVVWNDSNEDGQWAAGEAALVGWQVELIDGSGNSLQLESYVEPDLFDDDDELNTQNSAVTLLPIGVDVADVHVFSRVGQQTSTGSRLFAVYSWRDSGVTSEWTDSSREMRMDFTQPVTYVSLDAVANSNGDYGRLEVYDASDTLIGRYTTSELATGETERMVVAMPAAEISYAIAGAHFGSTIQLDRLQVGPDSTVTTNDQGAYWLSWLPPAEYRVRVVPRENWSATAPSSGVQTVVLTAGQETGRVDFGQNGPPVSAWQNQANRIDVDNNGYETALDVLMIINDLNAHFPRLLPNPPVDGEGPPPYLDVNGDGYVTALDGMIVINRLNTNCCETEGEGAGEGERSEGNRGRQQDGGAEAEGEADIPWAGFWSYWNGSLDRSPTRAWLGPQRLLANFFSASREGTESSLKSADPLLQNRASEAISETSPQFARPPRFGERPADAEQLSSYPDRATDEITALTSESLSLDAIYHDLGCQS